MYVTSVTVCCNANGFVKQLPFENLRQVEGYSDFKKLIILNNVV